MSALSIRGLFSYEQVQSDRKKLPKVPYILFRMYTDKKENQIFFIYKDIQNGAVAKSYMANGLIWGNICAFSHILGSPSSYMTLQLLHSEFPHIWGNFDFLFYQCSMAGKCAHISVKKKLSRSHWNIIIGHLLKLIKWLYDALLCYQNSQFLYLYESHDRLCHCTTVQRMTVQTANSYL